jgi:glycosyltransferase involved in cell wall biosynthesis
LLEAMACGVVPVATDVGEHHSLVDGCGVLVDAGRPLEGLVRALTELARHPERRKTLGVASRNRARRLGWERATHALLDLYRLAV